jgi:hypothetical protein
LAENHTVCWSDIQNRVNASNTIVFDVLIGKLEVMNIEAKEASDS